MGVLDEMTPERLDELDDGGAVAAAHPRHFRKVGYIRTYTGRRFFPLDPHPDDVNLHDIAQSLVLRCRWTGQCSRFCSIATHSIRVAKVAVWFAKQAGMVNTAVLELVALLHDAAEAYLADVASPIKDLLPGWRPIEDRVQAAIHIHFGLAETYPELKKFVKAADHLVLWFERNELFDTSEAIEHFFNDRTELWPGYPAIPQNVMPPNVEVTRIEFERAVEAALAAVRAQGS